MTKYSAAPGSRLSDADALVIGPLIERIVEQDGFASADALLAEASKPESPAHAYFEWDDQRAAHAHRLDRARLLIRSIRIVVETTTEAIETKAFHITTQDGQRGYRPAGRVFADVDLSNQVVRTALRELSGWKLRYAQYRKVACLAPVFLAIDGASTEPEAIAAE